MCSNHTHTHTTLPFACVCCTVVCIHLSAHGKVYILYNSQFASIKFSQGVPFSVHTNVFPFAECKLGKMFGRRFVLVLMCKAAELFSRLLKLWISTMKALLADVKKCLTDTNIQSHTNTQLLMDCIQATGVLYTHQKKQRRIQR